MSEQSIWDLWRKKSNIGASFHISVVLFPYQCRSTNVSSSYYFIIAMPLCFYSHSIQFKAILNTTFIVYRIVKQLHVSILHTVCHQTCVKQRPEGKNCTLLQTGLTCVKDTRGACSGTGHMKR